MATCTAFSGVAKSCSNNVGGITQVWLYDTEDVTAIVDTAGTISSMTLGTGDAGQTYIIKRNTSNFTEEAAIDLVNGSTFVTQTLNLMFHRREAAKSYEIQLLGEGQRDLLAVVLDANGIYWVMDNLQLSAVGEGSGTAKADGSKYSLAFTGEATEYAWDIAYATLTSFDSVLFP